MYGWQQGELQIWSGSERVNHFWELKGYWLNFPFVFKFAVNWLQRTKNAAKQSISPLTDMQHVNRSVEQSVILRILCTVLLNIILIVCIIKFVVNINCHGMRITHTSHSRRLWLFWCGSLAQNLPTNLLWNRLWFVIGIKSTFKREL